MRHWKPISTTRGDISDMISSPKLLLKILSFFYEEREDFFGDRGDHHDGTSRDIIDHYYVCI